MKARTTLLLALVVATAWTAGCTSPGGLTAEAKVSFDGSGSGSDDDRADCEGEALLDGNGEVRDGRLLIEVIDGNGDIVFERDFEGDVDLGAERIDGDAGEWTLKATRSGDDLLGDEFHGEYDVFLECKGL